MPVLNGAFPDPLRALVLQAKNKMVDIIVTTAGGVEEDLIKVSIRPLPCSPSSLMAVPRLVLLLLCFPCLTSVPAFCAKCLGKTYIGDFALKGADLRTRGLNRVGNLLVPNENYCHFEVPCTPTRPLPSLLLHLEVLFLFPCFGFASLSLPACAVWRRNHVTLPNHQLPNIPLPQHIHPPRQPMHASCWHVSSPAGGPGLQPLRCSRTGSFPSWTPC